MGQRQEKTLQRKAQGVKKEQPPHLTVQWFLELLPGLEPGSVSHGARSMGALQTSYSENALSALGMRSPVLMMKKEKPPHLTVQWFLELLPGLEPGTSSLPTILEAVLPCVSYRKLLDKALVYQRLFGFAYRCLL